MKRQYYTQVLTIIIGLVFTLKVQTQENIPTVNNEYLTEIEEILKDNLEVLEKRRVTLEHGSIALNNLKKLREEENVTELPSAVEFSLTLLDSLLPLTSTVYGDIVPLVDSLIMWRNRLRNPLFIITEASKKEINSLIHQIKNTLKKSYIHLNTTDKQSFVIKNFVCDILAKKSDRLDIAYCAKLGYNLPRTLNYILYGVTPRHFRMENFYIWLNQRISLYVSVLTEKEIKEFVLNLMDENIDKESYEDITYSESLMSLLMKKLGEEIETNKVESYLRFIVELSKEKEIKLIHLPNTLAHRSKGHREALIFTIIHGILTNLEETDESQRIITRLKEYIKVFRQSEQGAELVSIVDLSNRLNTEEGRAHLKSSIQKYMLSAMCVYEQIETLSLSKETESKERRNYSISSEQKF